MELFLYIADDIRQLVGGKQLLLGVFPDRVVVLKAPASAIENATEVPLALRLSLLACVSGLDAGRHTLELSIDIPGERSARRVIPPVEQVLAEGNTSMNVIVNVDPLLVREPGVFAVQCVVDQTTTLHSEFTIRLRAVEQAAQPEKPTSPLSLGSDKGG